MSPRTCHICGYSQAPEKRDCPACGWSAAARMREGDDLSKAIAHETQMIARIRVVYPVGMAPPSAQPLDPVSLSIVMALKDSPFSDDVERVAKALAAKTYLLLRRAKITAGELDANAIYDYRLELAYGGENNVILAADKELLILWAHFTPIVTPP